MAKLWSPELLLEDILTWVDTSDLNNNNGQGNYSADIIPVRFYDKQNEADYFEQGTASARAVVRTGRVLAFDIIQEGQGYTPAATFFNLGITDTPSVQSWITTGDGDGFLISGVVPASGKISAGTSGIDCFWGGYNYKIGDLIYIGGYGSTQDAILRVTEISTVPHLYFASGDNYSLPSKVPSSTGSDFSAGLHAFQAAHTLGFSPDRVSITLDDATSGSQPYFAFFTESGSSSVAGSKFSYRENGTDLILGTTISLASDGHIGCLNVSECKVEPTLATNRLNGGTGVTTAIDVNLDFGAEANLYLNATGVGSNQGNTISQCEIIIFNRPLTESEAQVVQGYLAHKWGDNQLPDDHPYKSKAPLSTATGVFNGAQKRFDRKPAQMATIYLDKCDEVFGSAPCEASGSTQCFNTKNTCLDPDNYNLSKNGKNVIRFISDMGDLMPKKYPNAIPALVGLTSAASEIRPTKGISVRASGSVKIRDFYSNGKGIDPYYIDRQVIASDNGTFFQKLLERNIYYSGRKIEIEEGYIDFDGNFQSYDGRREYVISSAELGNGVCSIKYKDTLSLADDLKAKVPSPTEFSLGADLGTGAGTHVLLKHNETLVLPFANIDAGGTGYDVNDYIRFTGGNGSGYEVQVTAVSGGAVTEYTVTNIGSGYVTDDVLTCNTPNQNNDFVLTVTDPSALEMMRVFGLHGATGYARINDEIIGYTADIDGDTGSPNPHLHFSSGERSLWGTENDSHEEDDAVQWCLHFGDEPSTVSPTNFGETIDDVAYEVLVNQGGIPAAVVNKTAGGIYSWEDEKALWLSSLLIRTIISEPREANKLVNELGTMVGVNFFHDEYSNLIRMKAETPELDLANIVTITDVEIEEDSFKLINSEKERISRVYYYYTLRDHLGDYDKRQSYRNLYNNIDIDSEREEEYGSKNIKTVNAYGVRAGSTATSVSQRLLNRFKVTPKTCQFNLDVAIDPIHTGDHFYLRTKEIVDIYGDPALIEMQCLSVKFDVKKENYIVKAKQFRFGTLNVGKIAPDFATISVAGTGYAVGDSLTFTSATGSGFTVDVAEVGGSGEVTMITPTALGSSYVLQEVLTCNTGGQNNDLVIIITNLLFSQVTGGIGVEDDPYTGFRQRYGYICNGNYMGARDGSGDAIIQIVNDGNGFVTGETVTFTGGTGTGFTASITALDGAVTKVVCTSNAPSGGLNVHSGYSNGDDLTGTGALLGVGLQVRVSVGAKMSAGEEPYLIG